uniref:Ubiquitin carboxyl-terminal hydrolase MINDY n=1 Tax=Athene cunicularia TaxID=194338 RepID=A0A663MBF4_ATHCN
MEDPPRRWDLLFGDVSHRFSCEWANAHFRFHQPCSDLAYALEAEKVNVTAQQRAPAPRGLSCSRDPGVPRLRRVSGQEQGEALAAALADTLWAAAAGGGGGRRVVVCLAAAAHIVPRGDYEADSFTERVSMSTPAANRIFFKDTFGLKFKGEGSHGVILFLYSLLFSRTLERVQEDLDCTATPLLEFSFGNITCTQVRLASFLKASGVAGERWLSPRWLSPCRLSACLAARRRGTAAITTRLHPSLQASPGLRTPRLPVWLCSLAGRHGVLFGTDSRLLSDWKRERVFHLHFYSGRARAAHLTIDTHSHPWEEARSEGPSSPGKRRPLVEMAIRSKWTGASVSWNGTEPFF